MGKGGCDVLDMGTNMIRQILGCICCLLCTGPILTIVGIAIIASPNHYAENVALYNSQSAEFTSSSLPVALKETTAWMGTYTPPANTTNTTTAAPGSNGFNTISVSVVVQGNQKDVDPQTSVQIVSASGIDMATARTATLTKKAAAPGTVKFTAVVVGKQRKEFVTCDKKTSKTCTSSEMDQKCRQKASCATCGRSVRGKSTCECTWYESPKYICTPLTLSKDIWAKDSVLGSCDYSTETGNSGFGTQPMECYNSAADATSVVPVKFMSSKDPYIVLQRITKGSESFGLTHAQQLKIGTALLVIGLLITAAVVAVLVLIKRKMMSSPEHQQKYNQAVPWGNSNSQQQANYQPMGGNTQQQGYPQQQQQGYPQQQQQAYQQPPPQQPYGQPPQQQQQPQQQQYQQV